MESCLTDMHIHSTASDGTDGVRELLAKVRRTGIRVFSLPDHDTIQGSLEMERLVPQDMLFVKGIEFSCITRVGKCHILGYDYDETAPCFQASLEEGRRRRRRKLDRRLRFLKETYGIGFSDGELHSLYQINSVGKPHLGNLLVAKGVASNKEEAIETYLNPCKTESDRLDAEEVVHAILSAGGIPVWAHPLGGTGERPLGNEEFQSQLELLADAGVKGLECYYSIYTQEQIQFLLDTAERRRLYISGGSDYHGVNKTVQLGCLNAYGAAVTAERLTLPFLKQRQ